MSTKTLTANLQSGPIRMTWASALPLGGSFRQGSTLGSHSVANFQGGNRSSRRILLSIDRNNISFYQPGSNKKALFSDRSVLACLRSSIHEATTLAISRFDCLSVFKKPCV